MTTAHTATATTIQQDGDTWQVLQKGASRDGKTYCHLASTTRGKAQRNGFYPIQMCDWIDDAALVMAGAA